MVWATTRPPYTLPMCPSAYLGLTVTCRPGRLVTVTVCEPPGWTQDAATATPTSAEPEAAPPVNWAEEVGAGLVTPARAVGAGWVGTGCARSDGVPPAVCEPAASRVGLCAAVGSVPDSARLWTANATSAIRAVPA